jgi:ADP-dependent NAD(P)H-hydrate dehydratase / NAD(P)H-hydrate epimerase
MTLPGWLEALPDAAEQRALDEWAINDRGIAGLELMERAGAGLAQLVAERVPDGPVAVVVGKGNNGGDGFVVARKLREQGRDVRVLTLVATDELRGDARTNCERLPGEPPEPFEAAALSDAAVVVDAIFGTGFSGEPRDPAAAAIEAINRAEAPVIACDVPSGVDASTGEVAGSAVQAAATATFNAAKPGLWIAPGKACAGEVRVIDIGIPDGGPAAPTIGLIANAVTDGVPRRGSDSTKFAAGNVMVCGGSTGLTGAPCLASEAAARAGAGYVTALVPASLNSVFEIRLLEVMTVPLSDLDGVIVTAALPALLERTGRADALVLGPGLGRDDQTMSFARDAARQVEVPLLLDADGLNAHAGSIELLAERRAPTVITPHAGELGRLLGVESSEVQAHRLSHVREAARRSRSIVVLKGDDTLVAAPDGRVAVSRGGAAALATAGTGDVLSGVIAAFLAKHMDPFQAASAGVFVHAAAGRLASREIGAEGVIARDVIESLPKALPPVPLA